MHMDGGRDGEKEPSKGTPSCRRAGSSWSRGNSAWTVGGKTPQGPRRKLMTDFGGMNFGEAGDDFSNTLRSRRYESYLDSQPTNTADDPPVELNVQKEEGVFRLKGSVETVVDPDTLYGIITDYSSNARVFRNVDRVEVEQRGEEKVVTQFLHWNFLMWSGSYDVKMRIKDYPQTRSISYELEQPGFLKIFNGSWTIEPLASVGTSDTSKLTVDQRAMPAFFPPGPLAVGAGTYAQNIMSRQVKNLLTDLATEAKEVKKIGGAAGRIGNDGSIVNEL